MSNVVKNLIEYTGLANTLPELCTPGCFRQFELQERLTIPQNNPDAEQIIRVMNEIIVSNTRVVRTAKAVSLEGQALTGFKLIVEGELIQRIEYLAEEPSQPLHAIHSIIPFCSFIILSEDFIIGTPLTVAGYIEDIYVQLIDKRTIYKNLSILIVAE